MLTCQAGSNLDPAKVSRRAKKMSRAGKILIQQRILAGDSNAQIIARLKAQNLLACDDHLSTRQFYYYRAKPETRLRCSLLTEQGREACLRELSEGVVGLSDLAHAARQRLREDGERLPVRELKSLMAIQSKAVRIALHASGGRGGVKLRRWT